MSRRVTTFALSALAIAGLAMTAYVFWPAPAVNTVTTTARTEGTEEYAQQTEAGLAAIAPSQTRITATSRQTAQKTNRCTADATTRSLQYYRQLAPQEWRTLNAWQSERGLSQTRLRADGELSQEPSPYLNYDIDTLSHLAGNGDADAQYWLAVKYRESDHPTTAGASSEDKSIVIPRLLNDAAGFGHVQAMLAMGNYFYEQSVNASTAGQTSMSDYPDLQIKARAWQHVAAWRMGRLPERNAALTKELEQQAGQLAAQLIEDIRLRREQQGLAPLDNIVPDVVIGLLQTLGEDACDKRSLSDSARLVQR